MFRPPELAGRGSALVQEAAVEDERGGWWCFKVALSVSLSRSLSLTVSLTHRHKE